MEQTPPTVICIDLNKEFTEQLGHVIHNRWHPDIPAVSKVTPGEVFRAECFDAFGDYLEIEILDIQLLPGRQWGFTGIFDINNGGGFLDTHFKTAAKVIWDFEGIYASSRHIPGVRFPGVIGTAPSKELLEKWNRRGFLVYVPGANLSIGDLHFSQGDGEIAICGGIEIFGAVTIKTRLIKKGVKGHGNLSIPIFMPGPLQPQFSSYLTFEGISVDEEGRQHYLDASLSYKQAVLNCIEDFKRFGCTGEQVYMLISACPCEGRINSIVDSPNACCSVAIPTEIFGFDELPKNGGHTTMISVKCPVS